MIQELKSKIEQKKVKICTIGLGYVGLPTAVFFAHRGFEVVGVDVKQAKIETINKGISPLRELDLDIKLKNAVDEGKLKASSDTVVCVDSSDLVLITVPTPVTEAHEPDLSYVVSASKEIAKGLKKGQLVILESTVYPGVTEEVVKPLLEESGLKAGPDFGLAYCPERYNPGDPEHTLVDVNRIVGGITPEWGNCARMLYSKIIEAGVTQVKDIKTAEAAKVIENIQRDLNIALMNELALIFERMGIDVMDVIEAASTKWNFVKYIPGAGVGGHCLPHDPYYLTKKAKELGYHPQIILAGRKVNDSMPLHVFELVQDGLNEIKTTLNGSRILILGASYKEDTGDLRTSPTEKLVEELKGTGAKITIVEPYADSNEIFGCRSLRQLEDSSEADAIILMTAHNDFRLEVSELRKKIKTKDVVFVDGRRVFSPKEVKKYFVYRGIGAGD